MRSSLRAMSVPGAAMLASMKRSASVPYCCVKLQRVHAGAVRLRHLRAFGGAHQRMQIEARNGIAVRDVACEQVRVLHQVQAHHDHARVPEEKNVVAADEQARGIERRADLACRRASRAWKRATGRS